MEFYHRQFTRLPGEDPDILADAAFLKANFVDFFGTWLQQGQNGAIDSLDGLLMTFWNRSDVTLQIHLVADGSFVKQRPNADWFNPHIRIIALVYQQGRSPFSTSTSEWTLCIVGGRNLKESDRNLSFLQVASWNGLAFRFYQSDIINPGPPGSAAAANPTQAWNYFGQSMDAFGANSYLGPFNGHVNGACIMKELHRPWLHWFTNNVATFTPCFAPEDITAFKNAPYLTAPGINVLQGAAVKEASLLEQPILTSVTNWYSQRKKLDFFNQDGKTISTSPSNIPRWVSHLLLSTTINMVSALASEVKGYDFDAPADHFYDSELLNNYGSELLDSAPTATFSFKNADYIAAVKSLGLSLLCECDPISQPPYPPGYVAFDAGTRTLGGGKQTASADQLTFMVVGDLTEGVFPFTVLQSSYEDSQGVGFMQKISKGTSLLSLKTFYAIMMLDFWNPIYSWRRGVLMQYMPKQTTFNGTNYDLEKVFIANVQASSYAQSKAADSPEYQFLNLLNVDLETHQTNVANYITAADKNTRTPKGLLDYMTLAESRRRIYRPLPLDEFGFTMPYARTMPWDSPWYEMTSTGQIQLMPARGFAFLTSWTLTLAGDNPVVIPLPVTTSAQNTSAGSAPLPVQNLPKPSLLAVSCQRMTSAASNRPVQGCPYRTGRTLMNARVSFDATFAPSWTEDILPLFRSPYWLPADTRNAVGAGWIGAMNEYGITWNPTTKKFVPMQLDDYDHVKENAITIYQHLSSQSMPITSDPSEYWPEEALATFKLWANNGFPKSKGDVGTPRVIISQSVIPTTPMRTRKDLRNLTPEELVSYQSKLDDILKVGSLGSKWQELGNLHGQWCLHYQEGTFLWHRAFLRYVEELIDFPIPYWNGYAIDASDPISEYAGIPPVFFQETYIHPVDKSQRPNPLKYALSLNGLSKDGQSTFVTRDPVLVAGSKSPGWNAKINLLKLYHSQITGALSQGTYSAAQGIGVPWANITNFGDDNPDRWYPHRTDFDGLFEQPHDNFHGWTGPDMADNSYTAFDPIFLSYHANMDRLVGLFMQANPDSQYTSGFPLQPFIKQATDVSYDDPRRYIYTTIGDMAKDTKALSYLYAPPASPDVYTPPSARGKAIKPSGGSSITMLVDTKGRAAAASGPTGADSEKTPQKSPIVLFENVSGMPISYQVDVFPSTAQSLTPDPVANASFIGRMTLLGMGPLGKVHGNRCDKPTVTRMLDASRVASELEKKGTGIKHVVTDLGTGNVLNEEERTKLGKGYEGRVVRI